MLLWFVLGFVDSVVDGLLVSSFLPVSVFFPPLISVVAGTSVVASASKVSFSGAGSSAVSSVVASALASPIVATVSVAMFSTAVVFPSFLLQPVNINATSAIEIIIFLIMNSSLLDSSLPESDFSFLFC